MRAEPHADGDILWAYSIRPVQGRRLLKKHGFSDAGEKKRSPNWGAIWKEGLVCGEPAAKHLGSQDLENMLVLKGCFEENWGCLFKSGVALTSVLLRVSLFASAHPI